MDSNFDLENLSRMIKEVVENMNMRFYDLEFNSVSRMLRVSIDREKGGVTISDCQKISNTISRALDASDAIHFPYTLEVTSPGIERQLRRPEHYAWAIGNLVEIDTGTGKIRGFLRGTRDNGVVVAVEASESFIPYTSIKKARVIEETHHGQRS
jgi:ribosome maturation factor RimP